MLGLLVMAEALVAFCTLAFEISVARLVAPHVGSSTDTWTAIIAAFLLALALGNRVGGTMAARCDVRQLPARAAAAAALAGAAIMAMPFGIAPLEALILAPAPLALGRIALFAALPCLPSGFLLGIATPLLMTAALGLSRHPGRTAGLVYGAGAFGSLAGVLAVLWVLLDRLGTTATILSTGTLALMTAALLTLALRVPRRRAVPA
jgi:predicted membrane-bound spermidine synthase